MKAKAAWETALQQPGPNFEHVSPARVKEAEEIFSFFDEIALSVRSGIADEAVLREAIGRQFVDRFLGLRAYASATREKKGDPSLYESAGALTDQWREEL